MHFFNLSNGFSFSASKHFIVFKYITLKKKMMIISIYRRGLYGVITTRKHKQLYAVIAYTYIVYTYFCCNTITAYSFFFFLIDCSNYNVGFSLLKQFFLSPVLYLNYAQCTILPLYIYIYILYIIINL